MDDSTINEVEFDNTTNETRLEEWTEDYWLQYECESVIAFRPKLQELEGRGVSHITKECMDDISKTFRMFSNTQKEWKGIVVDVGGSNLKLFVCQMRKREGSESEFELVHADLHPISNNNLHYRSGLALFDHIASKATSLVKSMEDSFFENCPKIPLGLVFSFDIVNIDFNDCTFRENSKKFNLNDLFGRELTQAFRESLMNHQDILKKNVIDCKTIMNDMISDHIGFASGARSDIASSLIVGTGINMAKLGTLYIEGVSHKEPQLRLINSECGKIGDSPHFMQMIQNKLPKKDLNFLKSIGNEIRVAEKLSAGCYFTDNFNFSDHSTELAILKDLGLKEMHDLFFSKDCILKQLPEYRDISDHIDEDCIKEFKRIFQRSASTIAAIAYLSIDRAEYHESQTINIGVQGGIVENCKGYSELLKKSIMRIIKKMKPDSKIEKIELVRVNNPLMIGMAATCMYLDTVKL